MKINIYYGGRGIIGDPTLYVIDKMAKVFEELNVSVERFDLYNMKNSILVLPQSLKEADGVILASTVEWHGVGGYIYNLLDACWLYGDKEKIASVYMAPVIMSTSYGEKEAELDLIKAWVTLGGPVANGITGYIADVADLENNKEYNELIEKCAENIYRTISQKRINLPISTREMFQKVSKTKKVFLTQQETEQLTEYISDEKYVNKQKQDIKNLTDYFKGKMDNSSLKVDEELIKVLYERYTAKPGMDIKLKIILEDISKILSVRIEDGKLNIKEGDEVYPDITVTLTEAAANEYISGNKNFNTGFLDGTMTIKGDFSNIRLIDEVFRI